MPYTGSINLIDGINQNNNGVFPLVDAKDVYVKDKDPLPPEGQKQYVGLDEVLSDISGEITDVDEKIDTALQNLANNDEAVDHQFVYLARQEDGLVSVSRKAVQASDIDGLEDAISGKQDNLTSDNAGSGISITRDQQGVVTIAATNAGTVTDVKVDDVSVTTDGIANIDTTTFDFIKSVDPIPSAPAQINADTLGTYPASDYAKQTDLAGLVSYSTDQTSSTTSEDKARARTNLGLGTILDDKQDKLTPGDGITIDDNNVISAVGTVTDVRVDDVSVLDSNGVANIDTHDSDFLRGIEELEVETPEDINATTLDGHPASYYATKDDLADSVSFVDDQTSVITSTERATALNNLGLSEVVLSQDRYSDDGEVVEEDVNATTLGGYTVDHFAAKTDIANLVSYDSQPTTSQQRDTALSNLGLSDVIMSSGAQVTDPIDTSNEYVSYNLTQPVTPTQQARARANIGLDDTSLTEFINSVIAAYLAEHP